LGALDRRGGRWRQRWLHRTFLGFGDTLLGHTLGSFALLPDALGKFGISGNLGRRNPWRNDNARRHRGRSHRTSGTNLRRDQ
jgi:hypothetical protein